MSCSRRSPSIATSPIYEPELVEHAVLVEVIHLHPAHLTVAELSLRIAADPEDRVEVETITHAIFELRRSGLFRYRSDDQVVEPTHAALRAAALFALG